MSTPFGPQLIGETEKTLNALLRRFLEPIGLTEPQWVTLRLARQLDGTVDNDGLVTAVTDRAHFSNAADIVGQLTASGLLEGGVLTNSGEELIADVLDTIAEGTAPIWGNLPEADVESATRVLNEVIARARQVLGSST
jgi:hypothetical protein